MRLLQPAFGATLLDNRTGKSRRDARARPARRHRWFRARQYRAATTIAAARLPGSTTGLTDRARRKCRVRPARPEPRAPRRLDRFRDPLGSQHARDHGKLDRRRWRLGRNRKILRLDPGTRDDGHLRISRAQAEFARIVAVFEQIMGPRSAQPPPHDGANERTQAALREPVAGPKMTEAGRRQHQRLGAGELCREGRPE